MRPTFIGVTLIARTMFHALLVTPDESLATAFTKLSRELGIDAHPSMTTGGIPEELHKSKYEAVLLDFDRVADASATLMRLRQLPSSKTAVLFALASDEAQHQAALEHGANLVFKRPIDVGQMRRGLRAAYDLMARERRRYFRCAVTISVLVLQANSRDEVEAKSINISNGGMALTSRLTFAPGDEVQVVFQLPGTESLIRALCTVIWDDKHGKTGLNFKQTSARSQSDLELWLDARLQGSARH